MAIELKVASIISTPQKYFGRQLSEVISKMKNLTSLPRFDNPDMQV